MHEELVETLRGGDEAAAKVALEQLRELYRGLVVKVISGLVDVAADVGEFFDATWWIVWRRREQIHEPAAFPKWIERIATSVVRDRFRTKKSQNEILVDAEPDPVAGTTNEAPDLDRAIDLKFAKRVLEFLARLDKLSPEDRKELLARHSDPLLHKLAELTDKQRKIILRDFGEPGDSERVSPNVPETSALKALIKAIAGALKWKR